MNNLNKTTVKFMFENTIALAKSNIAELALTNLSNEEKKQALDLAVKSYVESFLERQPVGWFASFLINKFIIPNIPFITQKIFDLLKTKIEGVTK